MPCEHTFAMGERSKRGPKLPPGVMRERVRRLLDQGLSQREVARRLGVAKTTVVFHARRLDVPLDTRFARRYDWAEIRRAYEGGLSRLECIEKFGCSADAWHKAVQRGDIIPRPTAMPIEELLVAGRSQTSRTHLKRRLIKDGLKKNVCEVCGLTEWQGAPLSMQLHHKNGDGKDNRLQNISLLCPNCHAQTDTWGGRNGHRKPSLKPIEEDDEA